MGEENNFYLAPWVREYKEKEKAKQTWLQQQAEKYAQSVEDSKHPNGHYMNEVIVTPQEASLGTVSSNAMLDNLVSTQRESAAKERKQGREMIQHIHEGTDTAAKWLAPLVAAPILPQAWTLANSAFVQTPLTALSLYDAGKDVATGNVTWKTGLKVLPALDVPRQIGQWDRLAALLGNNASKARTLGRELNTAAKSIKLQESSIFPGLIGWSPKQTINGFHTSNDAKFVPNFWFENWATKTHDAPKGIYLSATKPTSGFLTERPYTYQMQTTLEKPIIQIGEVQGPTKNGIRNQIERLAQSMNADGIIYQGIKDNQMPNQTIIKTLNPDVKLNITSRGPARISLAERMGIPKGERNQPFKAKVPTSHVQGQEAVKMFKEYGGEPIPEGSINGEQLRKYVAEARERYGIVGNKDITDEEIAQALYKHSKELGGNTAAVNAQGEPQLLFRGDTRRYTQLRERMLPEELVTKKGTMDNSLGNLFLGELPGTAGKRTRGLERYLVTGREFNGNKVLEGSGTGSSAIMPDKTLAGESGERVVAFPEGSYPLVTYNMKYGPNTYYKLPAAYSESGVNDINAFVVRTPEVRDASKEISVLNDDLMVQGGSKVDYHGPIRREVLDKDGFPLIVNEKGEVVGNGLAGSSDRQAMAQHYRYVLDDAQKKQQGLLKSVGETDGEPGNFLRDEHDDYTYFVLPNFNIGGIKHLLPYDLRIPRNWKDKNIYRVAVPLTIGTTIATQKQGGKMNILQFLKNGSGIHIKKENRGKFTDYCGGKVTSECIAKGKRSSNPAIRKRATFAANARKWKHEDGGRVKKHQAFVNGVSILDSNPDAYKYVKKKLHKAADGGNSKNWFSGIGNQLNKNSGTISNLGNTAISTIANGVSAVQNFNNVKELGKVNLENAKAQDKKKKAQYKPYAYQLALQQAQQQTSGTEENISPIVIDQQADKIADMLANSESSINQVLAQNAQMESAASNNMLENIMGGIGNLAQTGIGMLGNKSSNNTSSTNTTSTITSSTTPTYQPSYKYDMMAPYKKDFTFKV